MPKLMTQPSEKAVFLIAGAGVIFALMALLFVPKVEAENANGYSTGASGSESRPTSGPASSQPAGGSGAQATQAVIEQIRSVSGDGGVAFPIELYGDLLSTHISDGKVDYKALSTTGRADLEALVQIIAETDSEKLNALPKDEFIAWYINAYNILTLDTIVDHYPLDSIMDLDQPWDTTKNVAGEPLTLNNIEHQILRKVDEPKAERIDFVDPRLHFAVNCAAIGCPVLQDEPFTAANTEELYQKGALEFLNNPQRVRLENGTLYLSQLMDWYGDDFTLVYEKEAQPTIKALNNRSVANAEKVGSVAYYFSTIAEPDLAKKLKDGDYKKFEWIEYDWALNSQ